MMLRGSPRDILRWLRVQGEKQKTQEGIEIIIKKEVQNSPLAENRQLIAK